MASGLYSFQRRSLFAAGAFLFYFLTVTFKVADFLPHFTVMVALPAFFAVSLPFEETTTTRGFEDLYVILSVAVSGFLVTEIWKVFDVPFVLRTTVFRFKVSFFVATVDF